MILTMISTKGGVGKTTLTANLAAYLASQSHKVLMVDADIQPALSSYYNIKTKATNGLTHLITKVDVDSVISQTAIDNLDLIYSDDPDGELHNFILHAADGRMRLRFTLNQLRHAYHYILIDTQGAAGPLQDTAIFASDVLISPISPDTVSAREFARGTARVVRETREQALRLSYRIGNLYGVLSKVDRTNDAKQLSEALRENIDPSVATFLNTVIPAKVAYKTAATLRIPVHQYDSKPGTTSPSAKQVMAQLVKEIKSIEMGVES